MGELIRGSNHITRNGKTRGMIILQSEEYQSYKGMITILLNY